MIMERDQTAFNGHRSWPLVKTLFELELPEDHEVFARISTVPPTPQHSANASATADNANEEVGQ